MPHQKTRLSVLHKPLTKPQTGDSGKLTCPVHVPLRAEVKNSAQELLLCFAARDGQTRRETSTQRLTDCRAAARKYWYAGPSCALLTLQQTARAFIGPESDGGGAQDGSRDQLQRCFLTSNEPTVEFVKHAQPLT